MKTQIYPPPEKSGGFPWLTVAVIIAIILIIKKHKEDGKEKN